MYAIVTHGGEQHKVREGDLIRLDTTPLKTGEAYTFSSVLMFNDEDGDIRVGTPTLDSVSVVGTVRSAVKGPKTIAIRFKRRKNVRTRRGHRQTYQHIRIDRIAAD